MDLAGVAGWSALVAAVATVVGALFLGLFFAKGQPWGTLNDVASIVLMLATIPVAVWLADFEGRSAAALGVAAIGVVGMLAAAGAQGALVLRLGTYRGLLPYTLGAGAVVGVWYALGGVLALSTTMPRVLVALAVLGGLGYVALGYGFWRGDERHPLSIGGGLVLLVSSTIYLAWLGLALIAGSALAAGGGAA
jgi:hypothetical protein